MLQLPNMKIVILDARSRFRTQDLQQLDSLGAVFYEQKYTKLEEVKELYEENDGLVLGLAPGWIEGSWNGFTMEKANKIKNLKAVCLATTSYGWLPFRELAEKNIPVSNVPGKSTDAVAEYYIFMMTSLLRHLPAIMKNNWTYVEGKREIGTDANGLTAGIIGLGSIGRKTADLCAGYGMKVNYWSRSQKECPYQYQDLEEICKTSDVIFLCTVADESTKDIINQSRIDLMKTTAIFLTPIDTISYDKKYMIEKIEKGELGGLGFESDEEKLADFKGNIFPAPEIAYYTQQTIDKESAIMTESLVAAYHGHPVNVVNL